MKYGDFSSLVQLGVGIHLGTAILQMYGDIGAQPLVRTIARIKSLVDEKNPKHKDLATELGKLESDYDIFRIELFNEFKFLITINSAAAILLVIVLVVISYKFDADLSDTWSVIFTALATLPAPITLGVLWFNGFQATKQLQVDADELEQRAIQESD